MFQNFNFRPPKNFAGKKTQIATKLANGHRSEIHNFEMARHIDKQIADLSSAINGLKDGTKFGGIPPTSFDAT